jgi:hypothetical protein
MTKNRNKTDEHFQRYLQFCLLGYSVFKGQSCPLRTNTPAYYPKILTITRIADEGRKIIFCRRANPIKLFYGHNLQIFIIS